MLKLTYARTNTNTNTQTNKQTNKTTKHIKMQRKKHLKTQTKQQSKTRTKKQINKQTNNKHRSKQTSKHTSKQTNEFTCVHADILASIHAYMHAYIHTSMYVHNIYIYICIYIYMLIFITTTFLIAAFVLFPARAVAETLPTTRAASPSRCVLRSQLEHFVSGALQIPACPPLCKSKYTRTLEEISWSLCEVIESWMFPRFPCPARADVFGFRALSTKAEQHSVSWCFTLHLPGRRSWWKCRWRMNCRVHAPRPRTSVSHNTARWPPDHSVSRVQPTLCILGTSDLGLGGLLLRLPAPGSPATAAAEGPWES